MLPGPNQIVACPRCGALARYRTLVSGNTIGAVLWTDGRQVAPMLPAPPAVARCATCGGCHWLEDAEEVGEIEPVSIEPEADHPEWRAAPKVEEPNEEEYYAAIEEGLADGDHRERDLRVFAWWRANDLVRESEPGEPPTAPASLGRKANLEALVPLLMNDDPVDRIMRAEALREMGRFEGALAALDDPALREYGWVVERLRDLCRQRDTLVRTLERPA